MTPAVPRALRSSHAAPVNSAMGGRSIRVGIVGSPWPAFACTVDLLQAKWLWHENIQCGAEVAMCVAGEC